MNGFESECNRFLPEMATLTSSASVAVPAVCGSMATAPTPRAPGVRTTSSFSVPASRKLRYFGTLSLTLGHFETWMPGPFLRKFLESSILCYDYVGLVISAGDHKFCLGQMELSETSLVAVH